MEEVVVAAGVMAELVVEEVEFELAEWLVVVAVVEEGVG